jgi:hypothetical protein
MEGVLEGLLEKGSSATRTFRKERNAYLGRAIIRGSLCLLPDWTPALWERLLKLFSGFFWVIDCART